MEFNVRSNGWPTKELIDCTTDGLISYGIVQPGQNTNGGVPIVRVNNFRQGRLDVSDVLSVAANVEKNYKRTRLCGGEVLLTLVGSTGQTAIASPKLAGWNVARAIAVIRPAHDIGAKWVSICLQSVETKQFLDERANTTVQKTLNLADVKRIPIPLPPEHIRRSIESVFSSLDEKIDLNRRINQTLEAMAQAIFKSWFVDFEPVKAKIAAIEQGQDPLRAAMRAISGKTDAELDHMPREPYDQLATTAALFPDAMEDSELGGIPKGWTYGVLGDICSFTAGNAFKPEHQGSTEGDYPFIKVSDMNLAGNEVFIQSANNYVSKAQQSEMRAKLHPLGATVFAKIGVALISNRRRLLTIPTIIDNNMMSASPTEGKSGAYFLYSMLSTIDFNTLVSGTALPYLNVSDLRKIPIVRPPHEVGGAFELRVSSIFSMMQTLAAQALTLADICDNFLPKLLSGEIEISEALEG